MFDIDPAHKKLDIFSGRMTTDVWKHKYRWGDEKSPLDTFRRVADAIHSPGTLADNVFDAMVAGLWVPGGRILAGAGTEKRVTLMNCYVNEVVDDSMEGILRAQSNTALTLQQGGGIGTDFSTIRPEGAILRRTHTKASGPIPFMKMWDATSRTIRSAGDRRGAMMGTMSDTHPDLPKFISVKHTQGALEQFNISILVSDAFMEAVREDADWVLHFPVPPLERDTKLEEYDFDDNNDVKQYAYSVWSARDLWKLITESTYEYSEPGVIFIDRVNALNNLWYCEQIRCTNPCGEQPLPPHGTCNLGHINLARVVRRPFMDDAEIDYTLIDEVIKVGVRFLDSVIEVSNYPLDEQAIEEHQKRRLGIGFTGLADMLSQLNIRYGSPEAVKVTEQVTRAIALAAYNMSIQLAAEFGPFSAYELRYLGGESFVASHFPKDFRDRIAEHGIRNSLLLTVAPTGTTSILYGNVSSGGEPVFLHYTERRILKPTTGYRDEWETYVEWGYGARLYRSIFNHDADLPSHMVTADQLSVQDHIVMQAAAQRWIDASISKTVNIPTSMAYDEFVKVYELAYSLGCKGCTTYRPSAVRGAVLSAPRSDGDDNASKGEPRKRPDILRGTTYKIQWPSIKSSLYLTINSDENDVPFEVFINSKDARFHDWTTALTIMITSIFRKGGDLSFVARELQQVQSLNDSAFKDKHHHPSLVAYLGHVLEQHVSEGIANNISKASVSAAERCPQCGQQSLIHKEGCGSCPCGYSNCG